MDAPALTATQINACAALVQKGDPDRFLAAMAAPVAARGPLFTLYAFNLEIARAPWVTKEPIIAQMRLQFWRDVLEMGEHKAHEVAAPLQALLRAGLDPAPLAEMIDAREAEIGTQAPFPDEAALLRFLDATSGALMVASVRALGGPDSAAARVAGQAQGLANYLLAVPALEAAGQQALPQDDPASIARLAREMRDRLRAGRAALRALPRATRPALRAAWRADALLRQSVTYPERVRTGQLAQSEFIRRGGILLRQALGR
ncbi:squalene/phytoene synthase family protein [Rhodobacter sp. NTK016B]|uniref:squalene/phytoene synthase family protein n=1 Tax=Rhodobacter sp. NTK016B TaxID=2759676 RepID=UPI001A8CFB17|nr:squalene/phytoene synthase family protein [Rhodobacter sp. NTK016B]MBN8290477.1 squalene/phytoene synthase family protein [Rhodobacter sp. NTK016B]